MYKAIRRDSGKEIIILEPTWAKRVERLRAWDQEDALMCQECRQPVRVRAGEIRTWHFAHKHLQNCPIGRESPELLQARALLYHWLVGKFSSKRVTLEKQLATGNLPRPVDCWVSGERPFAYWIFTAAVRPAGRDTLSSALSEAGITAHWLFLAAMLRCDPLDPGQIHLTTTEREFMRPTDFDAPVRQSGRSLHYLDHETGDFTSYRGLYSVHEPQVFSGTAYVHTLDEMLVSPKTGEFIHPGEYEGLKAYRVEREKWEKEQKAQASVPRLRTGISHEYSLPIRQMGIANPSSAPVGKPESTAVGVFEQPLAVCEYCGEGTRDWWYHDGKSGLCKCRKCRDEGSPFSQTEK